MLSSSHPKWILKLYATTIALCACGIAFFARAIRAAGQGGIQIGFHSEDAIKLAAQTAKGAATILLSGKQNNTGSFTFQNNLHFIFSSSKSLLYILHLGNLLIDFKSNNLLKCLHTGEHPEKAIDKVTTPMGCTIAGLNQLEHS